jgi:hypothetical protein
MPHPEHCSGFSGIAASADAALLAASTLFKNSADSTMRLRLSTPTIVNQAQRTAERGIVC